MSDDQSPGEDDDDSDRPPDDEQTDSNGFHLEAGLRPLSDILGNLFEVTVTDVPPPPSEPTDQSAPEDETRRRFEDEPQQSPDHDRTSRPRTKRRRAPSSDEYLIDTRREDGEFVVTADIPGANVDDLSVGIDPVTNELVIGLNGSVLDRVDPPWRSIEATRVRFRNSILEVRLRPDEP